METVLACRHCGTAVRPSQRACIACLNDSGFLNVRLAKRPEERAALTIRYGEALEDATSRQADIVLRAFQEAVESSCVVMARSIAFLDDLTRSDAMLQTSFHTQVASGRRIPEDNKWDSTREAVESAINPYCWQNIQFAALSLDGDGDWNYGAYAITLKPIMIAHRTSFFVENPFIFANRFGMVLGQTIPPGNRSDWEDRGKLAAAKLHRRLRPNTPETDFPRLLLAPGTDTGNGDFIEAHIYGSIHPLAIERVKVRQPVVELDRPIWASVKGRLVGLGIAVEEV